MVVQKTKKQKAKTKTKEGNKQTNPSKMEGKMGQHLTSASGPFTSLENTSDLPGYSFGLLLRQTKKKKIYLSLFPSPLTPSPDSVFKCGCRSCLDKQWVRLSQLPQERANGNRVTTQSYLGVPALLQGFRTDGGMGGRPPLTSTCRAEG